jgi:RNA polymerase sigma-70 factor (ECF subfamily)
LAQEAVPLDRLTEDQKNARLSRMETEWSLVYQANRECGEKRLAAQRALLQRYGGAVYRYLLGALHDPHAADDLSQEFSLRFVRGDFRNADPQRGRFRDLVKTVLFHLIVDHQRRLKGSPQALPPDDCGPAQPVNEVPTSDAQFLESWRQLLLSQAWAALAGFDRRHGSKYFEVLRCRAENRELTSAKMAEKLTVKLNKAVTADWVRQTLRRAREQFADLLFEEIRQSLEDPTPDRLQEELGDLKLLAYCKPTLDRGHAGR